MPSGILDIFRSFGFVNLKTFQGAVPAVPCHRGCWCKVRVCSKWRLSVLLQRLPHRFITSELRSALQLARTWVRNV